MSSESCTLWDLSEQRRLQLYDQAIGPVSQCGSKAEYRDKSYGNSDIVEMICVSSTWTSKRATSGLSCRSVDETLSPREDN